jgi:alpha-N-acetylglucosaminidase
MTWWSWARWEEEIDLMALNGVNMPLAFTGQESVFTKVFMDMGFTLSEVQAYFSGPAFFPYTCMHHHHHHTHSPAHIVMMAIFITPYH